MKDVRCPMCRRLTQWDGNPYRPFCSERCKVHDLGNWASEQYRVADNSLSPDTEEDTDGADEPIEPPPRRH